MPEIKNTFTQGKMNQDLDERIVPNGQYIDAMNIKVTSSDDASVGVVQNILGNYRVESIIPPDSGYKCVATIANEKTNKLYWFVTQEPNPISAILQYDLDNEEPKVVLVDTSNSVLKFTQNIITGVNIIDNLLFWTDNNSEPKKINIDNCIQGTEEANPTGITSLDSAIHTRLMVDGVDKGDILEEHITVIKKSPKVTPSIKINKPIDSNSPKLFEKVFPRFSFRYKYKDGEYSSFGPFTDVVFNPVYTEDYNIDNFYSVKDSYNTAMVNNIESIEIQNFISNDIPEDVVQVEILYKEEGSTVVFSLKKINYDDNEWDVNHASYNTFTLESESIFAAIPENQLLRSWDNVPKKALAQEITGNRLVYGNYTQGYDLLAWNNIQVKPKIEAEYNLRPLNNDFTKGGLPSLKSQREYQLGLVFGDKYGRETPVFTSEEGGVNIPYKDIERELLPASNSLSFSFNLNSFIPKWADYYKVYVKETSGEYYNLIMTKAYAQTSLNVFDDEEDRVWLAFPSTDRNKISEDSYLILKKKEGREQVRLENKFKVLDIQNEAPDAVKFEYITLGKANQNQDPGFTDYLENPTDGSGNAKPVLFNNEDNRIDKVIDDEGIDIIHVRRDSWLNITGGGSLTKDASNENMFIEDIYFHWKSLGDYSEKYKIVSIYVTNEVYQIKLNRKITKHDAELAANNDTTTYPNLDLRQDLEFICERKIQKDLDEFSGKFFVQIVVSDAVKKDEVAEELLDDFATAASKPFYWFMDDQTDTADPSLGIINSQTNTPSLDTASQSYALTSISSGPTVSYTDAHNDWIALAEQLDANKKRGWFIDNMAFAAGQSDNDNLVKNSGDTWKGWDAHLPRNPRWGEMQSYDPVTGETTNLGIYGWTMDGNGQSTWSAPAGPLETLPLDPKWYNPRYFFNPGTDETKNINGLEGFITTDESHVRLGTLMPDGTTNYFANDVGYRAWRTPDAFTDTYSTNPYDGKEIEAPGNETGKYFMHISYLGPGKDLVSNDAFDDLGWDDVQTWGRDSVGNYMQGIWGGGVFSDPTANSGDGIIVEMEGNYDANGNAREGVPRVGINAQGYSQPHATNFDKQWDPTHGNLTQNEKEDIEQFLQNLQEGKIFRFASGGDWLNDVKEAFTIKSVTTKKLYNHTPWKAQYKWDGSTTSPTVGNGGLVTCGNSVDEAAIAWAETIDNSNLNGLEAKFNSFKDTVIRFGKRHNRRLVYIIELDKDPTLNVIQGGTTDPDVNSSVNIEFITSDPNSLLKNIIRKPAIWETEPKEKTGLDVYYEASQAYPFKLNSKTNENFAPVGCEVEILLRDSARNGKYNITDTIYLESWDSNDPDGRTVVLSDPGFNVQNNLLEDIDYEDAQIRFFRPDGSYTTTKLTGLPQPQSTDYVKIFQLDNTLDASMEHGLSYFNCYSFGNGVESNRIRDDFNAPKILNGAKASMVLDQEYKEENRKYGLIFSGIYNSISGVNDLNQFIMADNITKDLNPTYGSIQKLFQRRISLVTFCEDKVVSIVSNKDALYNADGNAQLVSSNAVLGDATPFVGDFGISQNPESFAKESYRAYFADKQRGAVLRLSMDGITPISDAGMDDYFRDNLKISGEVIGSYDAHNKDYNITLRTGSPEENLIANDSLDTGGESQLITAVGELVTDSEINNYTPLVAPDTTSGPFFASNIYENISINADVTIQNWDEIPVGSLIPATQSEVVTVTTPRSFQLLSFPNNGIFNQGFKSTNNWGSFSDPTDPLGSWGSNSGTARDPFSEKVGNISAARQYELKTDYTTVLFGTARFSSTTALPFPEASNSQSGNDVPMTGDIWWYNGNYDVNLGFSGTDWPATQQTEPENGDSSVSTQGIVFDKSGQTLFIPGEHKPVPIPSGGGSGFTPSDPNEIVSSNVLQYIDEFSNQPFAYATDTTVFNGEEVRINFAFKNPETFGTNPDNPRRIKITLYDGYDMSRTLVQSAAFIHNKNNSNYDPSNSYHDDFNNYMNTVSASDFKNQGIHGWDVNASHNYAIDNPVIFDDVDDSTYTTQTTDGYLKQHEVNFKFSDGTTDDKILIQNLQVAIQVVSDTSDDEYGIITFCQIRKTLRLDQPEVRTISYTSDNNAVPSTAIDAFATVEYSVSDWTVMNLANSSPLFSHVYLDGTGGTRAKSTYGYNFGSLTTTTLTQYKPDGITQTGNAATYQFPTTGTTSNNTVFYDDSSGGAGMYPNATTFGGGSVTYTNTTGGTITGIAQSGGQVAPISVNDKFIFDNVVDGIRLRQDGLSLTTDDWYFIDIIYPLANAPDLGSGTGMIIKSGGSADGTPFNIVNTDIYYVYSGSNSNFANRDVLRAIFQIDSDQASNGRVDIAIPSDVKVHIDAIRLININDTYSGGETNDWTFNGPPNNPPLQHSFDRPKIYGGSDGTNSGIYFEVSDTDTTRIADQWLFQKNNPIDTSLTPTPDGYEFKFTVENYESGSLQVCIGNGATAIPLSNPHGGLCIGDNGTINQNGTYSVEFNFSDSMGGYDIKRNGVSTGDTTVANNYIIDKIVIKNRDDGFVGTIDNISLKDLTNYYTGATIGSFNISGFDQNLYTYIDFEVSNGQIEFNSAPRTGNSGDQVQIEQLINKTIHQEDTYRVRFEHNITNGAIGFYYFSSHDNKGFKVEGINGTDTYNELHTISEDYIPGHLKDTFVFFVDSDDALGTTGTIDNIMLRREFIPIEPFPSTLSFSEDVRGWVSNKSFIPEQGVSISSEYFTMERGRLWEHNNKTVDRNTFYGVHEPSTITAVLNESPSSVKIFNTLNYEGTQSKVKAGDPSVLNNGNYYNTLETYNQYDKPGWSVEYIKTDKQEGSLNEFIEKEGKWFNYIKGLSTDIKTSDLSFQGLGVVKTKQTL